MFIKRFKEMKILYFICLSVYSSQVFAYLDPGSTSLIIQGLIAAIASAITVVSLYWSRFKNFFKRKSYNEKDDG
jgi:hypothetical protein